MRLRFAVQQQQQPMKPVKAGKFSGYCPKCNAILSVELDGDPMTCYKCQSVVRLDEAVKEPKGE